MRKKLRCAEITELRRVASVYARLAGWESTASTRPTARPTTTVMVIR